MMRTFGKNAGWRLSCAAALLAAAQLARAAGLPAGYVAVEHIESTGTQFINTGVVPGPETAVEMDFASTTVNSEVALFGVAWAGDQYLLIVRDGRFFFYGAGNELCNYEAGTGYKVTTSTNGVIAIDNETAGTTASYPARLNYGGDTPLALFAKAGGGNYSRIRLRAMKIWQAGALVRDFRPCYRLNAGVETRGLYDLVGGAFYANAGSGEFLCGEETDSVLKVEGSPLALGSPVSSLRDGYGKAVFTPGAAVTASVAQATGSAGAMRWSLAGWRLSIDHADGTRDVTASGAGDADECRFTPEEGDIVTLTWLWDVECKVAATADAGLAATPAEQWVALGGTVDVTATPGAAEFVFWDGDASPLDRFSSSFRATVDGPKAFHARQASAIAYVAPGGAGDGSSWASPLGSVQTAVDALSAVTNGALVCVKAGAYPATAAVAATGVTNLVIRGGYAGSGFERAGETVVARADGAGECSLFAFTASSVALEGLTVSNGFSTASTWGQGASFRSGCAAALRDCTFTGNGGGNLPDTAMRGGAVGQERGSLAVDGCVFARNSLHGNTGNVRPLGGALGAVGASVRIRDSAFDGNWTQHIHARDTGGGAVGFIDCPSVEIARCSFTTNYARRDVGANNYISNDQREHGPYGGVVYIRDSPSASIADCTIIGGWNNSVATAYPDYGWGGTLFFRNSAVSLVRTAVVGAGESGYAGGQTYNWSSGSIDVHGGSLRMTNVLHGAAFSGWALGNNGAAVEAVNCTFAGARGNGLWKSAAYVQMGEASTAVFRNCILRGNMGGDVSVAGGATPAFAYCILDAPRPGRGNAAVDPLFGDGTYFHPQSRAGRYAGGWFAGGAWTTADAATSPAVDAGDPDDGFGDEPQPNLRRVNAGYDGGTPAASKSDCGSNPVVSAGALQVFAYAATGICGDGATVSADVASTGGGENPAVTVAWGGEDKGTDLAAWGANTAALGAFAPWQPASHDIRGVGSLETVYYRFFASNGMGTACSDPVRSFPVGTAPTLAYDNPAAPFSHVYRTSARVHADLLSDGGVPTVVRAVLWRTDAPSAPVTNVANYGLAVEPGHVAVDLPGLEPGTGYACFVEAGNGVGAATLATNLFQTVADGTPLVLWAGPAASGRGDGLSASSASPAIQPLLDEAARAGDEIRVLAGVYTNGDELVVRAHPGLAIRGGYTGAGDDRSGVSVLRRDPAFARTYRILNATASTILLDGLTIADGLHSYPAAFYGQGVAFHGACDATVTNCVFLRNGVGVQSGADVDATGGAIGAQGGVLRVYGSRFEGNVVQGGQDNLHPLGGAVGMTGAAGSSVEIRGCSFATNFTQTVHARAYGGGALGFRSVPSVRVEDCTFDGNYCRTSSGGGLHGAGSPGPYGGAIHLSGVARADVADCLFRTNWLAEGSLGACIGNGGLIYSASSTLVMNRCVAYASGASGYGLATQVGQCSLGSVDVHGGSLFMTNVLLGAAESGWALGNNGGAVEAVNCTLAGGRAVSAFRSGHAYVQNNGSAVFRNCILWGNPDGDFTRIDGDAPAFDHCLTQTAKGGAGNLSEDPLFGDGIYFHPQSRAGRYAGGWFAGGAWTTADAATSPAVDAGDPAFGFGDEPQPNLRRINAGYDGGTAAASKSDCGSNPVVSAGALQVFAYAATGISDVGATVSADVASAGGGEDPSVFVAWGDHDCGADLAAWGGNIAPLGPFPPWRLATYAIGGISGYARVYYRFFATNGTGTACSAPVRSFLLARKPIIVYDTDGNPVSHRYRTYARVHANLLSDGGSATTVRLVHWPVGDPSAVSTNVAQGGAACAAGALAIELPGLSQDTEYAYFVEAENAVGSVRLDTKTFRTRADAEPMTLAAGPVDAGRADGASFEDASGDLQMLVDNLRQGGDEIHLLAGTNVVSDPVAVQGHPGLAIRGGYAADGTRTGGETVVRRNPALPKRHRVFAVTASTVVFDGVTVADGAHVGPGDAYGQGVALLSGCDALFTNCAFLGNGAADNPDRLACGGAIGAQNGRLAIVDCRFEGNTIHGGNGNVYPLGAAVGAMGATVRIDRSRFDRNWTQTIHARYYGGGALGFINCPSVEISRCTFTTNSTRTALGAGYYTPQKSHGPYGGTLYVANCPSAVVRDCAFFGGWNSSWNSDTPCYGWGGTMFFKNSGAVVVRTKILLAGANEYASGAIGTFCSGSIDVQGGSLHLTNVLHASAVRGPALGNNGAAVEAVNCTFADARGEGDQPGAAYVQTGAAAAAVFLNCIGWGNADGFLYDGGDGPAPGVSYADSQDGPDAARHILSADPKFQDPASGDFRLAPYSPCRNAGDKTGVDRQGPDLGGGRRVRGPDIDLGCYEAPDDTTFLLLQ